MSSMVGRTSPEYKRLRALYKTGAYPCHFGCGRRGTWVDHVPPLADFENPLLWVGRLLPACPKCQCQQGAQITNGRKAAARWKF